MLSIGDRVEIVGRRGDALTGKYCDIIHFVTGAEPSNQPASMRLPVKDTQPRYSVKLNNGEVIHHLRKHQMRKV